MTRKPVRVLLTGVGVVAVVATGIACSDRVRRAQSPESGHRPAADARPVPEARGPRSRKKRVQVVLALVAIAAVASTSVGVTMAIYSSRGTAQTNTFTAGTVSLTTNATGACGAATNNMVPGSTASCTLLTTYAGTVPGYMALDVFIATQKNTTAGGGSATNLYNPADTTNQAQITVSGTSPTVTYVVAGGSPTNFGTAITCPGAGTSLDGVDYSTGYDKCYLLSNLLVSTTAFASGTVTFTTGITLPSTQPNTYQGSSAVVVLGAHAVQSGNNAINCVAGGASPTAGAVCTPAGTFSWS